VVNPQVTVLMPVRDGESYLGDAIDSVVRQSFTDWELLVVDDGSTDSTPELVAAYADKDRRIRSLRLPRTGIVAALNRGVAEARAPLIARLDADDIAHDDRLRLQVERMRSEPGLVLLGTWAEIVDPAGKVVSHWRPKAETGLLQSSLRRSNPFIHSSVVYRAEAARDVGIYRAVFEAAEDYDLWLRLAAIGTIANIPRHLITYRLFPATREKLLRQAFSLRLAQRCEAMRRHGLPDPADPLTAPPDWSSDAPELAFCRADLAVYRALAAVDAASQHTQAAPAAFAALRAVVPELNRNERKLAFAALSRYLKDRPLDRNSLSLSILSTRLRLPPGRRSRIAS
jgi:GT2 family glycosyltransferase